MKNKFLALIFSVVLIVSLVLPVLSANPVDVERPCSLAIQYKYDEELFEGLEIKTYRIAEAFADGTFELCGDFKDYAVDIHGITSQNQWKTVASVLSGFIVADNIQPTAKDVTDENGFAYFNDLKTGIYLTLSVRIENDRSTTVFEDFLTMLPTPTDAEHLYDVTAYPKVTHFEHKPEDVEHKVVKQWKDEGSESNRPESITVDIYKNGEIYDSQDLSAENNWMYKWTSKDDGSLWQAVEREVPKGYTVYVNEKGNTIVITNICEDAKGDAPQTGDITATIHFAPILSVSGALFLIIAVWRKRTEK